VSSLRTLVSRYPKSDKAPAALWTVGQLLIRLGDVPGARVALATLIRDYPSTTEATEARRKLKEVEH
jgi:TolA-binding protein